jgi:hypothetical protein
MLAQMRSDRKAAYARMPPRFLEQMCTSFETHLGKPS